MDMVMLPKLVKKLPKKDKKIFHRIFEVEVVVGRLKIPPTLKSFAKERFGSLKAVKKQTIVKVVNKVTFEGAFYNQLRALRTAKKQETQPPTFTEEKCMLCNPKNQTAEDVFGRIESAYTTTAANIAKYDGWHSLIIPRKHNPLKLSLKELLDGFKTAVQWFKRVNREDSRAVFPYLIWNCLWRAGASQNHSHFQVMMSRKPYPKPEYLRLCMERYRETYGSNYLQDLYHIHRVLGLGLTYGGVKVFVYLTPIKEKEVFMFTHNWNRNLPKVIHKVLEAYKSLNVYSFNLSMVFPPAKKVNGWDDFPYIVRIVDRGLLNQNVSDIGAMELYASSIIASNPFNIAERIKGFLASP